MSKRLLSLLAVLILLLGAAPAGGEIVPPAELNGQEIGVQTGTTFDKMVEQMLPDSVVEYFNGKADLVAALTSHKVAAFVTDEPVAEILAREDSQITWLPDYLDRYDFAFVFPKNEAGKALRNEFNAFLAQLPEGTAKVEAYLVTAGFAPVLTRIIP